MRYLIYSVCLSLMILSIVVNAEEIDNESILRRADIATGANFEGLRWQIHITSTSTAGKVEEQEMEIQATTEKWVAETLAPRRIRGQKLVMVGRNMWFSKPELRKAVPISMRQRLTGGASNGDVASTNYAEDYNATRLSDEVVEGNDCYVFDLVAKEKTVTYDKVKYWIRKDTGLALQAEFFSRSGKLLKTATFKHDNTISVDSKELPFVSRMEIRDAINGDATEIFYSNINIETISPAAFKL